MLFYLKACIKRGLFDIPEKLCIIHIRAETDNGRCPLVTRWYKKCWQRSIEFAGY